MTSEPYTLRWGILATGGIAQTFTKDLLVDPSTRNANDIRHVVAAAASSHSSSRAATFLKEVGAPDSANSYGSYRDLVADMDVDIIYVATPHSHHYQHAHLALSAGKHVLIEKPITVNADQARILFSIAQDKGCFLMEAVWTRFFPLTREIQDLVGNGGLGEVKRVYADLSFWNDVEKEFGTEHRMVNMDLAGGALLDLGIYSLTWVFGILYALQNGKDGEGRKKPDVKGAMSLYEGTGCDEMTSIILNFPNAGVGGSREQDSKGNGDAHAIALTSIRVSHEPNAEHPSADPVKIQGELGDITVAAPNYRPLSYTIIPAKNEGRGQLASFKYEHKIFNIPGGGHGMFWEADECARCIRDGKLESEILGWEESGMVMDVMDKVRRQGGLVYPERIESVEYPLDGFGI